MGWSYPFWKGTLYPQDCKPEQFLSEYSKHFDTVEVDNTFYRIPYKSTITRWRDQTPPEFIFSSKFPRKITHDKMLHDSQEEVERFLETVSLFQDKAGPLLIQLPPAFKPEHMEVLADFLANLPKGPLFAIEVRNRGLLSDQLYSLLRNYGVSLAHVVDPNMPLAEEVTADFIYIRWLGDRKKVQGTLARVEVDRTEDLNRWADKIKAFTDRSLKVFGYFSKYFSGYPPHDAEQLLRILGRSERV
jgi:uncharacterized protein YecE (DUF72 family)